MYAVQIPWLNCFAPKSRRDERNLRFRNVTEMFDICYIPQEEAKNHFNYCQVEILKKFKFSTFAIFPGEIFNF